MFGVHFLCLWAAACAVKVHQVSFHTPFLNHTIVFWDKIKGRTWEFPGICCSTRTTVYFKCAPTSSFLLSLLFDTLYVMLPVPPCKASSSVRLWSSNSFVLKGVNVAKGWFEKLFQYVLLSKEWLCTSAIRPQFS